MSVVSLNTCTALYYSTNLDMFLCTCRYGMHVVPAFAQSVPLHDNHIGTTMSPEQDCLHYCMPGVPQVRRR